MFEKPYTEKCLLQVRAFLFKPGDVFDSDTDSFMWSEEPEFEPLDDIKFTNETLAMDVMPFGETLDYDGEHTCALDHYLHMVGQDVGLEDWLDELVGHAKLLLKRKPDRSAVHFITLWEFHSCWVQHPEGSEYEEELTFLGVLNVDDLEANL